MNLKALLLPLCLGSLVCDKSSAQGECIVAKEGMTLDEEIQLGRDCLCEMAEIVSAFQPESEQEVLQMTEEVNEFLEELFSRVPELWYNLEGLDFSKYDLKLSSFGKQLLEVPSFLFWLPTKVLREAGANPMLVKHRKALNEYMQTCHGRTGTELQDDLSRMVLFGDTFFDFVTCAAFKWEDREGWNRLRRLLVNEIDDLARFILERETQVPFSDVIFTVAGLKDIRPVFDLLDVDSQRKLIKIVVSDEKMLGQLKLVTLMDHVITKNSHLLKHCHFIRLLPLILKMSLSDPHRAGVWLDYLINTPGIHRYRGDYRYEMSAEQINALGQERICQLLCLSNISCYSRIECDGMPLVEDVMRQKMIVEQAVQQYLDEDRRSFDPDRYDAELGPYFLLQLYGHILRPNYADRKLKEKLFSKIMDILFTSPDLTEQAGFGIFDVIDGWMCWLIDIEEIILAFLPVDLPATVIHSVLQLTINDTMPTFD